MMRLSFVLVLVLASCGGGSANAPEPTDERADGSPVRDWPADEPEALTPAVDSAADEMPPWAPGMYPPAVIHWEIMSPNAAALADWYSDLFGWERTDWQEEGGGFEYYVMFSRGADYGIGGGIGQIPPPDDSGEQMPPYLTFYVDVADVDAAAARVAELGGTVIHGPFDVPDVGRMVMFADPGGHLFAMMTGVESDEHHDFPPSIAANPVVHWEIVSASPAGIREFYAALFGWTYEVSTEPDYAEVGCDHPYGIAGGIGGTDGGQWPEAVSFYVGVDDLQATIDRAVTLGGAPAMEPTHVMEGVDIAGVSDPDGHLVGLFLLQADPASAGGEAGEVPLDPSPAPH